jgi:hypothetical protein
MVRVFDSILEVKGSNLIDGMFMTINNDKLTEYFHM